MRVLMTSKFISSATRMVQTVYGGVGCWCDSGWGISTLCMLYCTESVSQFLMDFSFGKAVDVYVPNQNCRVFSAEICSRTSLITSSHDYISLYSINSNHKECFFFKLLSVLPLVIWMQSSIK